MQQATLRRTGKLFIALVTMLVAVSVAQVAAAGDAAGPQLHEGNPRCVDLGYQAGFKPNFGATGETPPLGAPVTMTDGTLEVTIDVIGTNGAGEGTTISWSSNIGVDAVIVKGGSNGNEYIYDPPAEATSGSGLLTPINSGGNRPEISHLEFCYDTGDGKLEITKTAATHSYISYEWKIDKTVDRNEIALTKEPTGDATYTIAVTRGDGTEHGWQVWGDITVTNNTGSDVTIDSLTDDLSGVGSVDVSCGALKIPFNLKAGEAFTCSYGPVSLPDGAERKNTATVTASRGDTIAATTVDPTITSQHAVPVTFDDPEVINGSVTVIDDYATPGFKDDDISWELSESTKITYTRTYWCKDAGEHTNTAWLLEKERLVRVITPANAVDVEPKHAQATVAVFCDTKTAETSADGDMTPASPPASAESAPAATAASDLSCRGADAVRGSRGDSAWTLLGRKGLKTKFFLSKRSYWNVRNLAATEKNPYFKLGAAYTMAKLHQLNGTRSTPALKKAMNWTRRYLSTHRPGYTKPGPNASTRHRRIVKKLRRVMRKQTRVMQRYADAMDAGRCTS